MFLLLGSLNKFAAGKVEFGRCNSASVSHRSTVENTSILMQPANAFTEIQRRKLAQRLKQFQRGARRSFHYVG